MDVVKIVKNLLLGLAILIFSVFNSYSQDYRPNIIPPSPEAASLGKFVEIPVSFYSGIPEISVPITEITAGDLSIPVSLAYHSAGIKVEEIASWTGIGWSLNAGGVVTRIVHGSPDNITKDVNRGFLGLVENDIAFSFLNDETNTTQQRYAYLRDISNGCYDAEPDLFYFNVNGLYGKFSFDWNGDIVIDSKAKVTVTIVWEDGFNSSILGWDIVSDQGITYKFRDVEVSSMVSGTFECGVDGNTSYESSWYLSEVSDINDLNKITLSYDDYTLTYNILNSMSIHHFLSGGAYCQGSFSGVPKAGYNQLTVTGKRIRSIQTEQDIYKIDFLPGIARTDVSGTNLSSLGEVWTSYKGQPVKKFQMNHDHSLGRLTLVSAKEFFGSLSKNPYQFFYSTSLPARNSKNIDHWGYANAASNGNSIVPGEKIGNTYFEGANREADLTMAMSGILKRIKYPTGGEVLFDFELNTYSFVGSLDIASRNEFKKTPEMETCVSFGRTGGGCNNGGIMTDIDETPFEVFLVDPGPQEKVQVKVILDMQPYTDPYFSGGKPIKAYILDASNQPVYSFTLANPDISYIELSPGSYKLKTEATWADCTNFTKDKSSITILYENDDPTQPVYVKNSGGLRIKSIKDYTASQQLSSERYFYYGLGNQKSSGAVYGEPFYTYASNIIIDTPPPVGSSAPGPEQSCSYQVRLGRNPAVFGETSGGHVGYQKVTVSHGLNFANGKTEMFYSSPYSDPNIVSYQPPFPLCSDISFKTGNLLKAITYNATGDTLTKEVNSYWSIQKTIPSLKLQYKGGYAYYNENKYLKGFYNQILGHVQLKRKITSNFSSSSQNPIVIKEEFFYDPAFENLKQKVTDYSHSKVTEDMYYSHDYTNPGSAINQLVLKNFVGVPIEVAVTLSKNGATNVINAVYKKFELDNSNVINASNWSLKAKNPLSDFDLSFDNVNGVIDGRYQADIYFTKYDQTDGRILTYKLADGILNSVYWGYGNSLPTAEVTGADYSQIYFNSFEEDGTIGQAVTGERYHSGTSFIIGPNQLPSGSDLVMTFWYYDGSWKLQNEIPFNATISVPGASRYDEVRVYPKGALTVSYTYDALKGIACITDQNNKSVKYTYDQLGRVIRVKDHMGNIIKTFQYNYYTN